MKRAKIFGLDVLVAENFAERAKGLIGRDSMPDGCGMLIPRCNAVHTFFMRFAIDVVFLDADDCVVKTVRNVRPWTFFVWGGFSARKALEVQSGREYHFSI